MNTEINEIRVPVRATILALAMGCAFNTLFYGKALGVSLPLFMALALLSCAAQRRGATGAFLSLASLAFSVLFAVRAAGELMFADFCLSLYLAALAFAPALKEFGLPEYVFFPVIFLLQSLGCGSRDASRLCSRGKEGAGLWARMGMGVFMAAPLLLAFIGLMSSADKVFDKLLGNVWTFFVDHLLTGAVRTAIVLVVATFFLGVYAWIHPSRAREASIESEAEARSWPFVEASAAMGGVNALFLVFSFIQVVFLLGGEKRVAALGITYSEYAREGFWQMMAIALLALGLSILVEEKVAREGPRETRIHKANLGLLAAMTGITMVAAFYRLWLYEKAYGFTVLRFYSHTFTVYLAAIFSILSVKVVREEGQKVFLHRSFLATLLLFLAWNLSDPHALIAEVNLNRHKAGERNLDVWYLRQLSDDAIPLTVRALGEVQPPTRGTMLAMLAEREAQLRETWDARSWPSFHLAGWRALRALDEIEKGPYASSWQEERRWVQGSSVWNRGKFNGLDSQAKKELSLAALPRLRSAEVNDRRAGLYAVKNMAPGPVDEQVTAAVCGLYGDPSENADARRLAGEALAELKVACGGGR